jgi:thioredoxin reductase (NADPH)
MAARLLKHPKVTVMFNTAATATHGDGSLLRELTIENTVTKEETKLPVNGLFYAIGHDPATSLVKGQVDLDEEDYIVTVPGTTETNIPGVFAAGDVQDKKYRQAITSAGTGCMAALDAERYITEHIEEAAPADEAAGNNSDAQK